MDRDSEIGSGSTDVLLGRISPGSYRVPESAMGLVCAGRGGSAGAGPGRLSSRLRIGCGRRHRLSGLFTGPRRRSRRWPKSSFPSGLPIWATMPPAARTTATMGKTPVTPAFCFHRASKFICIRCKFYADVEVPVFAACQRQPTGRAGAVQNEPELYVLTGNNHPVEAAGRAGDCAPCLRRLSVIMTLRGCDAMSRQVILGDLIMVHRNPHG